MKHENSHDLLIIAYIHFMYIMEGIHVLTIFQKTAIVILAVVRTWNLTCVLLVSFLLYIFVVITFFFHCFSLFFTFLYLFSYTGQLKAVYTCNSCSLYTLTVLYAKFFLLHDPHDVNLARHARDWNSVRRVMSAVKMSSTCFLNWRTKERGYFNLLKQSG
jgi:polyferredoxin